MSHIDVALYSILMPFCSFQLKSTDNIYNMCVFSQSLEHSCSVCADLHESLNLYEIDFSYGKSSRYCNKYFKCSKLVLPL